MNLKRKIYLLRNGLHPKIEMNSLNVYEYTGTPKLDILYKIFRDIKNYL